MANDVGTELATIQQTMRTDIAAYHGDKAMQARHLELLEVREVGTTPAPADSSSQERRNLAKLSGDRNSAYWRGPDAARLQARHLELVEGGRTEATERPADASILPIPKGATPTQIGAARVAGDVLVQLSPATRTSLESSFNALPPAVLAACTAELADKRVLSQPATREHVENFARDTAEGAQLVREWGNTAPIKLGRLRARYLRWMGRMPSDAQAAASTWFNNLMPEEAKSLIRAMVA
jgi:hypothetical protein